MFSVIDKWNDCKRSLSQVISLHKGSEV